MQSSLVTVSYLAAGVLFILSLGGLSTQSSARRGNAFGIVGMLLAIVAINLVADQLRDYLEDGNVVNAVNFPNVVMPRESAYRVAIANANVPNMLGQISTAMAHAGLNIHNMVNKSRGDMAYTLVDVDSAVSDAVVASLAGIPGVLSVRYLPGQP